MTNTAIGAQLNSSQALFELTLLNAEAVTAEFDDVVVAGIRRGIPPELLTRLKVLWAQTKLIAGEIVAYGKIIVQKVVDFLLANPKLAIGLAIGAAVSVLVASIPFLGPMLAPISTWIATLYGAGVGASMQQGDFSGSPLPAAIELASKFFELIGIVFRGIAQYWGDA